MYSDVASRPSVRAQSVVVASVKGGMEVSIAATEPASSAGQTRTLDSDARPAGLEQDQREEQCRRHTGQAAAGRRAGISCM